MSHFFGSEVYPTVTFANLPTAAAANTGRIFNVSDVGVNGSLWRSNGTLWAPVNGSVTLVQSGMPWIALSSGSIAANGALTAITALTIAHAKAWVYLPANAVATVAAAGWYYATFSTTTAGTIFLDQPAATFPITWPSSPTAVSDGKGAYTGVSTAALMPTVAVPANSMGKNGRLTLEASMWCSTGGPSAFFYLGTGNNSITPAANNTKFDFIGSIQNAGVTNVQTGNVTILGAGPQTNPGLYSIDTTAASTTKTGIRSFSATVNAKIVNFAIKLFNDGQ